MKIDRQEIYNKFKGHCAYCGDKITIEKMQVEHIIPKYNFLRYVQNNFQVPDFLNHLTVDDLNHIDNLFPSCRICNKWKDAFSLERFREEIQLQIERLNRYSANFRIAKRYGLVKETPKKIKFYFETYGI